MFGHGVMTIIITTQNELIREEITIHIAHIAQIAQIHTTLTIAAHVSYYSCIWSSIGNTTAAMAHDSMHLCG